MNVLLVNPSIVYFHRAGKWVRGSDNALRISLFPGVTLPYIAGIIQDRLPNTRIRIVDEDIEKLDLEQITKAMPPGETLVGLTAQTLQIVRAYELADRFRERGYKVALGGIHVSLAPLEESCAHADAVVVGEAEELIPRLLSDFQAGHLQPVYRCEAWPALSGLSRPRYELLPRAKYFIYKLLVQTARGCIHNCDFCSVRAFNGVSRYRPVGDVIKEIREQLQQDYYRRCFRPGRRNIVDIFFVDDNFCADEERTRVLCEALTQLQEELGCRFRWEAQMTVRVADNPTLLDAMARSGCANAFVGFESIFTERLNSVHKSQNQAKQYLGQIRRFHDAGIRVFAAWIVGFEGETKEERDRNLRFFRDEAGVDLLAINPLTPFVGTRFFARLKQEGKLRDERFWLSPDVETRILPLQHNDPRGFMAEYWRLNATFYSLSHLARVLTQKGRRKVSLVYLKIFFLFSLNCRLVRGVMSS